MPTPPAQFQTDGINTLYDYLQFLRDYKIPELINCVDETKYLILRWFKHYKKWKKLCSVCSRAAVLAFSHCFWTPLKFNLLSSILYKKREYTRIVCCHYEAITNFYRWQSWMKKKCTSAESSKHEGKTTKIYMFILVCIFICVHSYRNCMSGVFVVSTCKWLEPACR